MKTEFFAERVFAAYQHHTIDMCEKGVWTFFQKFARFGAALPLPGSLDVVKEG